MSATPPLPQPLTDNTLAPTHTCCALPPTSPLPSCLAPPPRATHTGKTLVPAGGSCVTPSGGYDISKTCIASAPVCMNPGSGKCVTQAEAAGR